jgi:hypothetical protein
VREQKIAIIYYIVLSLIYNEMTLGLKLEKGRDFDFWLKNGLAGGEEEVVVDMRAESGRSWKQGNWQILGCSTENPWPEKPATER